MFCRAFSVKTSHRSVGLTVYIMFNVQCSVYMVKCTQYDISQWHSLMILCMIFGAHTHTQTIFQAGLWNNFALICLFCVSWMDSIVACIWRSCYTILFYIVIFLFSCFFILFFFSFWLKQMNQRIVLIEHKRQREPVTVQHQQPTHISTHSHTHQTHKIPCHRRT